MDRENEAWKSMYGTTGGEFDERSSDALVLRAIQDSRGRRTNEASSWVETMQNGGRPVSRPEDRPHIRQASENATSSWVETMQNGGRPVSRPEDRPHIRQASENAGSPLRPPVRKPQSIATVSTPNVTNDLSDPLAQVTFRNGERTGEYINSNEGGAELATERDFDRLSAAYDELVKRGVMTEEEANRRIGEALDGAIKRIDQARKEYLNRINGRLPQPSIEATTDNRAVEEALEAETEAEAEAETEAEREEAEKNKAEVEDFRHKVEELVEKFDEEKAERINNIQKLASLRPELAELYAKNRRLFVTHKNRELFQNAQTQYNKLLNELLSLKTEQAYKKEQSEKWSKLSNEDVSKAHSDLKKGLEAFKNAHPNATKEELTVEEERLKNEITTKLLGFEKTKEKASAAFLSEYLKQKGALEEATIGALDNGTIWRRFTHKVIDNKNVKTALAVLGAAGFAASIIATGGIASVSFAGWAGVASGAARGALSGAIMSRQDSKNSAVHRLATEEELKKQFEEIAITSKGDVNINNVASFLVGRYESANETDRSNNRKRTLISAGIGAAIGGAMGAIQLNKTVRSESTVQGEPEPQVTGYTEGTTETRPTIDIDTISHARGKGTEKLFLELGGESSEKYYSSGAHKMLLEIGKKYGLTPGKSGWTHPGPISEWPSAAQGMAREVAEEWAKHGLIPSQSVAVSVEPALNTASEPIADAVSETVKNVIFNNFAQGSAFFTAGAIGGLVGGLVGKNNRINQSASNTPTSSRAEVSNEEDLFMDNTPDFGQNVEIPQANVENARGAISRLLGALGQNISDGDLGLIIRGNERPYSDAESAQLEALWGGLDEDARRAISGYMAYEGNGMDSRTTNSFQNWLNSRSNETVGVPVETPAEASEATSTEATPEASSTPSAEDLRRQQLFKRIETFSRNLGLSDENISIMKEDVSNNSDEYQDRASAMLESLTPEQRREIFSYFRNEGDNALGSAFYSWLSLNHGDDLNANS